MEQNTSEERINLTLVSQNQNNTFRRKLLDAGDGNLKKLLSQRLFILLTFSVVVILFELFHYLWDGIYPFDDFSFWVEIIVYGFVLPLSMIVILNMNERRTIERDEAVQELDHQFELSQRLSASLPSEELVNTILKFPAEVLPSLRTYLHLHNPDQNRFELVGAWGAGGKPSTWNAPDMSNLDCMCLSKITPTTLSLITCQSHHTVDEFGKIARYCLPLAYGDVLVGLIHIDLPADLTITHKQARILTGVAPGIALALNNVGLQKAVIHQSEVSEQDRKRIAKDLHDTLGQNIAYLHFKLDTLSSDVSIKDVIDIRQELQKMRDVATEAYDQMRGSLYELQPVSTTELSATLLNRARNVGSRAGFDVQLICHGQRGKIAPEVERQVLYICREALNNIEKHAQAKHVDIQMDWGTEELTVEITDDGVGIQPKQPIWESPSKSHFGIAIMQERAQQVNGNLTLNSLPTGGTQMVLWVPLHPNHSNLSPSPN